MSNKLDYEIVTRKLLFLSLFFLLSCSDPHYKLGEKVGIFGIKSQGVITEFERINPTTYHYKIAYFKSDSTLCSGWYFENDIYHLNSILQTPKYKIGQIVGIYGDTLNAIIADITPSKYTVIYGIRYDSDGISYHTTIDETKIFPKFLKSY